MKNIISCHMPKTAGTSFLKTLNDLYKNNLYLDYSDKPLHKTQYSRERDCIHSFCSNFNKKITTPFCIHGHFLPTKYIPLKLSHPDIFFITWIRNPIDRLMSHFKYWKANIKYDKEQPLRNKFYDENWNFEKFATCNELTNIYSKFLFCFPKSNLNFIGITERYKKDMNKMFEMIGIRDFTIYEHNIGQKGTCPSYQDEINANLIKKIKTKHKKDFDLYEHALNLSIKNN